MPKSTQNTSKILEATVTSKGQVTLPSDLRKRLGLHQGSRIRFMVPPSGEVRIEPVRYSIDDLWEMADRDGHPDHVMTFEEMNAAKVRRKSQ